MWPPGQPRRAPAPDSRSRSAPGEVSRGGCLRRRTSRVQAKAGKRFAYAANGAPLKCRVPGLMETIKPGGTSMVAPRKYPEELRERSIRMTLDAAGPGVASQRVPADR